MTQASSELFQAVDSLCHAVEAEFTGNGYYLAASQVTELRELLGPGNTNLSHINGVHLNFAMSLDAVRKRVDAELLDNRFYLVAHKLDVLAFLGTCFSKNEEVSHPAIVKVVAEGSNMRSFEDLAAAAKARVEASALAAGIPGPLPSAPSAAAQPEVLADGELERRSSEPCAMAELAPPSMETVATARISPNDATPSRICEISPDLGSSATAPTGGRAERESGSTASQAQGQSASLHSAEATHDPKAASTGQTVEAGPDKSKSPMRKSPLTHWFGRILGRRS